MQEKDWKKTMKGFAAKQNQPALISKICIFTTNTAICTAIKFDDFS